MATTVRIDQINQLSGFPVGVRNVPPNYPSRPTPDKLSLLWKYNNQELYHRFSPYTNYHDSMFSGILSNQQPFVYTYIDEFQKSAFNQLPEFVKGLALANNITPSALQDVVRVSKFLVSSWGLQYTLNQRVIQQSAPFDETRTYNPLSPILSTVRPLTLGLGDRPMRHIEGGLFGLLNSVTSTVGINLQSGFKTPSSTGGDEALPLANLGQGKGLIRGETATRAKARFNEKWIPMTALESFAARARFSSTRPRQPVADETHVANVSAFIMAVSRSPWLRSVSRKIGENVVPQMWYPRGLRSARLRFPYMRSKMFNFGTIKGFEYIDADIGLSGELTIQNTKFTTGYDIESDTVKYKYSDNIKIAPNGTYTNSDMLFQYGVYTNDAKNFPSAFSDEISPEVQAISDNLKAVIAKLNTNPTYLTVGNTFSKLLSSGETRTIGADYRNRVGPDNKSTPKNQYGVIAEYNVGVDRTVDISVSPKTIRMATSFRSDALNQLGVLGSKKKFNESGGGGLQFPSLAASYPGYTEYKPYEDDLVAFFFYDVVNQKYIPFRATVKGISEGNTAFWDELRFIGRSDQLYSYNGFSRTLSFTFNIVISSLSELLPTWQKVNYMASCVKPSNYTRGDATGGNKHSKFIVPPMFMLTIGDLYKFQPIVVTSINVNIPDDATWETLNELNTGERAEWSFLNGQIRAPGVGKKFAQLPKEAEIAITCNLLEKERAIVGGSHFGHAPLADDGNWLEGNDPILPSITEFEKDMTVRVLPKPDRIQRSRTSIAYGPETQETTSPTERVRVQRITAPDRFQRSITNVPFGPEQP